MSKIERYQGDVKAFASNAQGLERTVFGETTQANDLTSQVTAAFLRGWGIVGPSEHPSLEDFNAAMYAMSQFIAYQHQVGVPEWHAAQEYYTGSVCTHEGVSYQSLIDDNVGNEPPSAEWTPILTAKNGGEYFQPKNEKLTAFSGLAGAANRLPYFTGANALALTALTAAGRDLIGKTDVSAILQYLGIGEALTSRAGLVQLVNSLGGSSSLVMPQLAVTNAIQTAPSLGKGQTLWDMKSERALGATYTNHTGYPIAVYIRTNGGTSANIYVYVNDIEFGGGGSTASQVSLATAFFIVPPGATYRTLAPGVSLIAWSELR